MKGQFPDPVALPLDVIVKRHERVRQLVKSCILGICVRSGIIIVEFVGVLFFNSASLLMDALSSLIDVATSVLLVIFIKVAARPPDEDHPFGHGRYEPLVGFQLGLFMALIGAGMLFQQIFALSTHSPVEPLNAFAWMVPLGAVFFLEIGYQYVMRTAKRQNSSALAADALHYRMDALTSVCATISLLLGSFLPVWSNTIDHLGAIFIALVMIVVGIVALRKNADQVVDRAPEEKYFESVKKAAMRVSGVRGTEKIRIMHSGPDAHVDIDIEVDPLLSVEVAHTISQKVRVEIQKDWPIVQDVTVHIEPFYPNDH